MMGTLPDLIKKKKKSPYFSGVMAHKNFGILKKNQNEIFSAGYLEKYLS